MDFDSAPVRFDYHLALVQPDARSALLGGLEGVEKAFIHELPGHTATPIGYGEDRIVPLAAGQDPDFGPVGSRFVGVEDKIDNHLLDLFGIKGSPGHGPQIGHECAAQVQVRYRAGNKRVEIAFASVQLEFLIDRREPAVHIPDSHNGEGG